MAVPLKLGFTDYEQIFAKKKLRRQRFLDEMEAAHSIGGDAPDPSAAAVVHASRVQIP